MEADLLRFPHKKIRAEIIKEYMTRAGYKRAVCFSCGNAARELQKAGVDVLHIGAAGDLVPNKWFTQAEIHNRFPGYFDATSGHLPMEVMLKLAERYRGYLGNTLSEHINIPCGSGETLVCLKIAFPCISMTAVYNLDDATKYEAEAPLNKMVELLASGIIK